MVASLLVGTILRARLVLGDDSVYWPDEIFKSFEPAHRAAFGYGFEAWEFRVGANNWAFPGLLAGALAGLGRVGLDDPATYIPALRALLAASTLVAAWAAYRLARTHDVDEVAASVAAALVALLAPVVYFSHRALTETASLLPVTLGLALALPATGTRRAGVVGTSLLGLSVLFRLQNGLFCLGLLAVLAARRDWPGLRRAGIVLAVWAMVLGLIDWVSWGVPFQSVIEYARFSFTGDGAARFGTSPFGYYADFLGSSIGPVAVAIGAVLVVLAAPRAPALLLVTLGFLLVHSLEAHKEARFILPALPLLAALVAIGVSELGRRWLRRPAVTAGLVAALVVGAAVSGAGVRRLNYDQVGQGQWFDPAASAYSHGDAVNRLLLAAHDVPGLCGLKVETEMLAFTGGYAYLHRDVPFYGRSGPSRESGMFNYAIGLWDNTDPGVVATEGGLALTQVGPPSACAPDPGFTDQL